MWENVSAILERELGPPRLGPPGLLLPLTVLYVALLASGTVGNLLVCIVVARLAHFRRAASNRYVASLAAADLLTLLLGLPNDLQLYWRQYPWELGEAACKARAFVAEATGNASVLTIVAFTAARHRAVCCPLREGGGSRAAGRALAVAWIIAGLGAAPFAVLTGLRYVEFPAGHALPQSAFCALRPLPAAASLLRASTAVFFLLPLAVIAFLYCRMWRVLRQASCSQAPSPPRRAVVHRMLVAVVVSFFTCLAPFHAQRLLVAQVEDWTPTLRTVNEVLYLTAGCFYYLSATINPILYTLMSRRYRAAMLQVMCGGSRGFSEPGGLFRGARRFSEVSSFQSAEYAPPTPRPAPPEPPSRPRHVPSAPPRHRPKIPKILITRCSTEESESSSQKSIF